MVHCDEMCSDGEPVIIFRSGTILMKDGFDSDTADIYSSMFRNGGYHISNSFSCCARNDDISQAAVIAVKRAELKSLHERNVKWQTLIRIFVVPSCRNVDGTDFRRFMDARYDDFAFLFEMFVGSSAVEALQAIVDSKWLCAFGASGLVFGLAMTVVMYLAGRK